MSYVICLSLGVALTVSRILIDALRRRRRDRFEARKLAGLVD